MAESTQEREWDALYGLIVRTLAPFGKDSPLDGGDYWVVDDNWGNHQQKIEVENLAIISPTVVASLRGLLADYPDWEIIVGVAVAPLGANVPKMGLTIRPHEIVDGLRREYLPAQFKAISYAGARPGTEFD